MSKSTDLAGRDTMYKDNDAMTWYVRYRQDTGDHTVWHPSPEAAIEATCRLIDDGPDVYGIGTGSLTDSIDKNQIARIYAIWARAKYPFGIVRGRSIPDSRHNQDHSSPVHHRSTVVGRW